MYSCLYFILCKMPVNCGAKKVGTQPLYTPNPNLDLAGRQNKIRAIFVFKKRFLAYF